MSGLRSLVVLEIRTILRDRSMQIMFVATIVFFGSMPHLSDRLPGGDRIREIYGLDPIAQAGAGGEDEDGEAEADAEADPCAAPLPALALEGALPWRLWWEPQTDASVADVVASVSTDPDGVLEISLVAAPDDGDSLRRAKACLRQKVAEERRTRIRALGLGWDAETVVQISVEGGADPADPVERPPLSLFGMAMGTMALMIAGSVAIEAVPRRRASGLLEQLQSTQTRSVELVSAWVVAISGLTVALMIASALAYLASTAWLGQRVDLIPGLHAVPLGAVVAAASVRTSLRAMDVQSSTLRWFGVLFALIVCCGLSLWWIDRPVLSALVPLGGPLVATSGLLGGWGWLASAASLGWTAAIVVWCASALDSEETSSAGLDPSLQRHARGDYLPEVLFFGGLGLSVAVFSGAGAFAGNLWLGATFAFPLLMLLPSLLAPSVLGLPRDELLPLARPRWRDLALSLPVSVGLTGLAAIVMGLTFLVIPSNPVIEAFIETMEEALEGTFAKVAVGLYPAICEEFLYRGVIFGLLLRGARPWVANTGQALLFALAHVVSVRLPWTFVFGWIAGWIRYRTGTLWTCMALHFAFNVLQGLLPLLLEPGAADPEAIDWLGVLPWLIGLLFLPLYTRSEAPGEPEPGARP